MDIFMILAYCDAADVDDIVDIHKYLMKKMTWCK